MKTKARINEILAERSGQDVEKVAEDTERDNYMSSYEARDYGLIDEVIEVKKR